MSSGVCDVHRFVSFTPWERLNAVEDPFTVRKGGKMQNAKGNDKTALVPVNKREFPCAFLVRDGNIR